MELMVMEVETDSRGMPSKKRLHIFERINGVRRLCRLLRGLECDRNPCRFAWGDRMLRRRPFYALR